MESRLRARVVLWESMAATAGGHVTDRPTEEQQDGDVVEPTALRNKSNTAGPEVATPPSHCRINEQ